MTEQGSDESEEKQKKNMTVCQQTPGTFHLLTRLVRAPQPPMPSLSLLLSKRMLFDILKTGEAVPLSAFSMPGAIQRARQTPLLLIAV